MNTNTKATRMSPEHELGQCETLCLHLADLLSHVLLLSCPTGIELGRARAEDGGRDHEEHDHPCPNKLAEQHGFTFQCSIPKRAQLKIGCCLWKWDSDYTWRSIWWEWTAGPLAGVDTHLPNEATPLNAWDLPGLHLWTTITTWQWLSQHVASTDYSLMKC